MKLRCNYIALCENWTLRLVHNMSWILIGNRKLMYCCCLRRSITICNRIYSPNSINAFQFLRHISIAKLSNKVIELCRRFSKLQFRIISIEIVSNRRNTLRKLTMIDIFFNNIHNASHHVLLGNLTDHVVTRKISIYPYLCHRTLVYTDVILFHSKGTEMLRQLRKTFKRLSVQMQEIRIWYVFDVRESDRRFFQEKLLLVRRRTKVAVRFRAKIKRGYQLRMVFTKVVHLFLTMTILLRCQMQTVLHNPLRWVSSVLPSVRNFALFHLFPIFPFESFSGVAVFASHSI